tara:strand:+ start:42 stop:260 length:219 start_codon:yes stop_codon:yes gene_type:complete
MKTSTLEKVLAGNSNMTPLRGERLGTTGHILAPFSQGAMIGGLAATILAIMYGGDVLRYVQRKAIELGGSVV